MSFSVFIWAALKYPYNIIFVSINIVWIINLYRGEIDMSNDPDVIRINNIEMYNETISAGHSETKRPFLIGVAGGTASGKVDYISCL